MKKLFPISLLLIALMLSGCAWMKRHTPWHHTDKTVHVAKPATAAKPATRAKTATGAKPVTAAKSAPTTSHAIVTPDESLAAKVLTVNTVGRFVVLNFPEGRLPKLEQHLFLYRGGLKAAEVKVVGPQQETSIVADILSGDAQPGDTVRDQ